MTFPIGILLTLLAVMVWLFLTEKIPIDLTAFAGLVVLVLAGYVAPGHAFTGFASPAVITMLSIFIVSGGLLHTGVADMIGGRIHAVVGSREIPLIITIMLVAGILSAFMNNIAATAVLMPAVASMARRSGLSPARLFMPLSFGAILGGTTTLVGTPPNILGAAMLEERGMETFRLFDFTPVGAVLLGVGIVYMITAGRWLLPKQGPERAISEAKDLARVYRLDERLFAIQIPRKSRLAGMSLGEARLGAGLGLQVVSIERRKKRQLAPEASTVLQGGDVLHVEGRLSNVQEMLSLQGVEVQETRPEDLPRVTGGASGIRTRLEEDSPLVGLTLRDLEFRDRFGLVVVGIVREGDLIQVDLARQVLAEGDEILAMGPRERVAELAAHPYFEVVATGLGAVAELSERIFQLRVPEDSSLVGRTVRECRLGELAEVTVGGIIRQGETHLAISPDDPIQAGDRLLVAAAETRIDTLLGIGEVQLDAQIEDTALESEDAGIVEAALAPRSSAAGKTLAHLRFRERYALQVLAVWREGSPIHAGLANLPLQIGDALLIQGTWEKIRQLAQEPDYVVLTRMAQVPRRTEKAPFALAGLLLMILMVVTGYMPIHVAAFTAAVLIVLSGALTMEEAYRAIEWRAIFLVAAILPVGIAMETSGAALWMSEGVTQVAGPLGPYVVLAALVCLSSLLSQGLDGAPAVVLLTPVALEAASQLGMSPYPIMMAVSLAASAAFMTPFSHKANLLVMGVGGYRSWHYLKVGTPLTVILLALLVFLVPVFFPF